MNVPANSTNTIKGKAPVRPVAAVGAWSDEPAARFAAVASSALGDGSDSDPDTSREVSASPSFCAQHLWWKAHINGPAIPSPTAVNCLLDCGSHLVLILPELANHLGLHHHCLHHPEAVDVAVDLSMN